MTATVDSRASEAGAPQRHPPERRGHTSVSDRAATKIACRVAREVPEVREVSQGNRPWASGSSAQVHGDRVTVDLRVTVAYPAPLRTVARTIRRHVAARVGELTGLAVTRVDLTLADLADRQGAGSAPARPAASAPAQPHPPEPPPTAANPTRPAPAAPHPATPDPTRPDLAEPHATTPDPTRPVPAEPPPTAANPTRPAPAEPHTTTSDPTRPDPTPRDPAALHPAPTDPTRPDPAGADPAARSGPSGPGPRRGAG
ncbi:Asp23/Gls24 family envelope stress response protein [Nonomuraea sp. LPB2021202275-12-8]|uniref:Asp23/Gls24 family envelope stress response protein n=1 Tax=Nonomuraea sp. LPB2021202275-12-8 TaxID=3120159 RepID=UPI00300CEC4B